MCSGLPYAQRPVRRSLGLKDSRRSKCNSGKSQPKLDMFNLQAMEVPSKAIVSSAEPPQVSSRLIPPPLFRRATALAVRIFLALASVAALTFLLFRLMHVNATTAGFFYLLAILFIATKGGIVESTVASVAAMCCFNFFFLPPVGTLTIADPQNWVALFTFLVTSLTASQLSAHGAKRRAQEAIDRQSEMERLYSLSRALLLADATQPMANQIVKQIALAFEFSSVALTFGPAAKSFAQDFPEFTTLT